MPITYDPSTPFGQTCYLAGDTDRTASIWTDGEIDAALSVNQQTPRLAAAWLLDGAASSGARLAIISRTDSEKTDLSKLAEQLRTQARYLRSSTITSPVVLAPDPVFVQNSDNGATLGTMNWER